MFIKYTKLMLATILAFSTLPLFSVCPEMEVWSDGTNYRYLIKDWHADYIDGRVSIKQQADIVWAAHQKKAQGVFVIAEDLLAYSSANSRIQYSYREMSRTSIEQYVAAIPACENIDPRKTYHSTQIVEDVSPLVCLIHACQKKEILHYNAECNQALTVYSPGFSKQNEEKASRKDVIEDLFQSIEEIGKHKERHASLKKYHVTFCAQLEGLKKIASIDDNENDFIDAATKLRNHLVNAKTIHKLIDWKQIKHGFICEGLWHIENIKDGLKELGYKHLKSLGNSNLWRMIDNNTLTQIKADKQMLINAFDLLETHKQMLNNALDLRQEFQQIFAEQKRNALTTFLINYRKPIAATVAVLGGLAAWLYWKKK